MGPSMKKALALAGAAALAIVVSPAAAHGDTRAPRPGPAATCTDAPLTVDFPTAPTLGSSGKITVTASDGTIADTIDLADPASASPPPPEWPTARST